ncbi:MAG: type II toxin-antitoxin system Phd/YefM family antitoxin [Parvibaculaceae bacterium]
MKTFTTADLNKHVGEVTDAAAKGPVVLTRHNRPKFVMLSFEDYERITARLKDSRKAFRTADTPEPYRSELLKALEEVIGEEGGVDDNS